MIGVFLCTLDLFDLRFVIDKNVIFEAGDKIHVRRQVDTKWLEVRKLWKIEIALSVRASKTSCFAETKLARLVLNSVRRFKQFILAIFFLISRRRVK